MAKSTNNLVWIDLEMTGLDPDNDKILEIATIITDGDLNVIAEGPCLVIHESDEVLDNMGEWCVKQHGKSGLTQRVKDSNISLEEAEEETLSFIRKYTVKGKNPLCGNSVGQDQKFLEKHMPRITKHLHYRIVDVSSFKEMLKRWYDGTSTTYLKSNTHRALDDIKESIEELKFYREGFFIDSAENQ